ncbi:hypothetical protein [Vallitalea okinawensis]|uniref:hypothetical protein n=1 Tax=Vallitalea okinawensis TaxID=2078660 RepID=UPI000CFC8A40|nr:hypothetical protein [Vallitalea okinawensis]
MKGNRNELEDIILGMITQYAKAKKYKNVVSEIAEYLEEHHKMNIGRVTGLLNQSIPLFSVSDYDLYCLAIGLNWFEEETKIVLNQFFTVNEIEEYEAYEIHDLGKEEYFTVVFHNVDEIGENHFISTATSYGYIADLEQNGVIFYNEATQRQKRKRIKSNVFIEEPYISKKAVNEIARSMVEGRFISNTISFNVRRITGQEKIRYNAYERTLTIEVDNKTTFLDIPDGMHRLLGMVRAIGKNPECSKATTVVNIFHHTEDEIRKFIVQESKRTSISKRHIEKLNPDNNLWMDLAKRLNNYGGTGNILNNNVVTDKSEIDLYKKVNTTKYITFRTLSIALEENFSRHYKDAGDIQLIHDFLADYGLCFIVARLKRLYQVEEDILFLEGMIVSYIALLSQIYSRWDEDGSGDWKIGLLEFIKSSHFTPPSKNNEFWSELGVFTKGIKPTNIRKISYGMKEYYSKLNR